MADLTKVEQVVQDIYDIKIQGATNIAKAAFQTLIDELEKQKFTDSIALKEFLFPAMDLLEKARPTEPMMFNGMAYIKNQVER
jgi:methylthioribose-1-phosphate isomerase